jgi:hypothetical protein
MAQRLHVDHIRYSCPEKFFPVIQMRCHCEERSSLPL